MRTITSIFPDPEVLLALAPEELAEPVLILARDGAQNGSVHLEQVARQVNGNPSGGVAGYPQSKTQACEDAICESWSWLTSQGLLVPVVWSNGTSGWMRLSRRALKVVADGGNFDSYRQSVAFPRELLHPLIADAVWLDLLRGDLEDSVFKSFRAVEESVRKAGGYGPTDIGVTLMRKAFHTTTGPLSDQAQPEAEREALAHLFTGAIGSYKNPHSHRTVTISDPHEAREMVLLASHLLRIVETRRLQRTAASAASSKAN
jgi:uncharacterized protein (TIGR02391 family)